MTGIVLCGCRSIARLICFQLVILPAIVNEIIDSGGVRYRVIVRIKVQFRDYSSSIAIRS